MQHLFTFALKGLTRACSIATLGAAVVLWAGSSAWSQRPNPSGRQGALPGARPNGLNPGAGQETKPWTKEDFGIPEHEAALTEAREEIELLEVQIAAKRARIRVAEARLKQTEDQAGSQKDEEKARLAQSDVEVLRAELEAERAELCEPELLLKHAQARVKELEQAGASGAMAMGHRGDMGLGMGMDHFGMGLMGHPGMGRPWAMMRDLQIENNLNLLRVAVERLEREVDGLLDGSIKPGSVKGTTASDGSSKDTTRQ
jgi:hypothetical protein